jgi:hypothetical protein
MDDDQQDRPRASAALPPRPPVRCGWLAPSPAVRSGGKEADLLRARLQRQQRRRTRDVRPAASMTGCSSRTTWYPPLPPCLDPHCLLHTLPTGKEVKSKGIPPFSATARDSGGQLRHEEMRLLHLYLNQQGGLCGGRSRACSSEVRCLLFLWR